MRGERRSHRRNRRTFSWGRVGRPADPTRDHSGLDTPARGGRWPGEPGMIGVACVRSRCRSVARSTERSPPRAPPACRCVRADVPGRVGPGSPSHRSAAPHRPGPWRAVGRKGTVADGPLIVQSDKTLLLEVDHRGRCGGPRGDRSLRGARTRARARPHLPRHPAGPVERAGRRARRGAGRRRARPVLPLRRPPAVARRRRRHHGPLRPPAAHPVAGPRPGARRDWIGPCSRRCCGSADRSDARRAHRRRHRRRARRPSAVISSRPCSRSVGPRRTSRGTSTARRTRSSCAKRAGRCATTSARPSTGSSTAARAWSCCPAARARRSWARPPWRRRRRPR